MQQTSSRKMEDGGQMNTQQQENNGQSQYQQQYQESQNDDFIEQMLSTIPNYPWPPTPHDLPSPSTNPTDTNSNNPTLNFALKPGDSPGGDPDASAVAAFQYPFDEASLVAKLRQQQMNEVTAKSLLLQHQQQFLMSCRSLADAILAMPLSLGNPDSVDNSSFRAQVAAEASMQALYNGLAGSLVANGQPTNQQHFQPPPLPTQGGSLGGGQNCRSQGEGINQAPPASALIGGNNGAGIPQTQRVRARRGQATDPHSIAERLRRERIAERIKALQELVPNANKTDKASMLDEIIDYVKFLQLQVKVLSMSRLGGAAVVAPLVADMTSKGGVSRSCNENQTSTNDIITVSEHQVAKLLEQDMGSAMQYLQGKGLCLMPISLASAISSATSIARTPSQRHGNNNGNLHDFNANNNNHPFHSSMSLTNGEGDDPTPNSSVKDPSKS